MSRYSRLPLSASTDWRGIQIVELGTPGDLIHTPSGSINIIDEVYLWAENLHTAKVLITVEFGGINIQDLMMTSIPTVTGLQIVQGRPMNDTLEIRVHADVANVINIWGYINRIEL
tara:strand:+ start:3528 stop:3875 length:348 start_codon:yes stop_codon:yes gene_type:complete